ncbi:hypothetical protein [Aquimarina algicola]|uniref:Uncharacterized protein n=1 Tax=Aquimarina algicola TaxID=2589995 RepID=A0A504JGJ3_9FLAO|nr:hypothetical protein [Aquimarina algicola]TPN85919.1 hypothetical protein FHK87_11600 [Aquimarina algicola]
MKTKIITLVTLLFVSYASIAQNYDAIANNQLIAVNEYQEPQHENFLYTTSQENSESYNHDISPKTDSYSNKNWRKIKRQMRKNKKRVSNFKSDTYISKTLDTVFVNPYKNYKTARLSGGR